MSAMVVAAGALPDILVRVVTVLLPRRRLQPELAVRRAAGVTRQEVRYTQAPQILILAIKARVAAGSAC
jgi:hypothetical protein